MKDYISAKQRLSDSWIGQFIEESVCVVFIVVMVYFFIFEILSEVAK